MSFVVLSNSKNENEIVATTGSIDKPYQFRNNLSSTFELPSDCQVALQSAKVTLDGSIVVGKDNRTFYFFFGKPLSHTGEVTSLTQMSDSINYPIKIVLGPEIIDTDSLLKISPPDLAPFLQKALRKFSYHPNLAERSIVVPKYNTGVFVGYTFTIVAGRGTGTSFLPPDASAIDSYDQRIRLGARLQRWAYAGGTFSTPAAQSRNRFGAIASFDVPPLDNKIGIFKVDITGCIGNNNTPCVIGLSRDATVVTANGQAVYPGNINADVGDLWGRPQRLPRLAFNGAQIDDNPFWCRAYTDYAVTFERANANTELRLKVYHCVSDSTEDELVQNSIASWKIAAFDYNSAMGGGGAISNYDFVANPNGFEKLIFTLNGDEVTIQLEDDRNTIIPVFVYDNTRTKEKNLCPAGEQGRWSLFPVLGIYNYDNGAGNYDKRLTIDQWNGTNEWRPNWTTDGGWLTNVNATWNRAIDDVDAQLGASNELALRTPLDYGVGVGQNSTYGTYEAVANVGPYEYKLYQPRLIVSPNSLYVPSNQSSMANLLGFPDTPWAVSSIDAGTGDYTIASASPPNIISVKSIFCRLDNFTQQSVNGKKGSRSQIIGHLPRYVQTANANYGPLYLEANNLIYLDLDNPEPMKVNSFDISLCYVDETLATTLVGTSIICLHFRKKPK